MTDSKEAKVKDNREIARALYAKATRLGTAVFKNKSCFKNEVELMWFGGSDETFPFAVDNELNVCTRMPHQRVLDKFRSPIFSEPPAISKTCSVQVKNCLCGYVQIRGVNDVDYNVLKFAKYLFQIEWVGVVRTSDGAKLYLLPTSSLTHHLGITSPDLMYPKMLHGLFVKKERNVAQRFTNASLQVPVGLPPLPTPNSAVDVKSDETESTCTSSTLTLKSTAKKRKAVSFADMVKTHDQNSDSDVTEKAPVQAPPQIALPSESSKPQKTDSGQNESAPTPSLAVVVQDEIRSISPVQKSLQAVAVSKRSDEMRTDTFSPLSAIQDVLSDEESVASSVSSLTSDTPPLSERPVRKRRGRGKRGRGRRILHQDQEEGKEAEAVPAGDEVSPKTSVRGRTRRRGRGGKSALMMARPTTIETITAEESDKLLYEELNKSSVSASKVEQDCHLLSIPSKLDSLSGASSEKDLSKDFMNKEAEESMNSQSIDEAERSEVEVQGPEVKTQRSIPEQTDEPQLSSVKSKETDESAQLDVLQPQVKATPSNDTSIMSEVAVSPCETTETVTTDGNLKSAVAESVSTPEVADRLVVGEEDSADLQIEQEVVSQDLTLGDEFILQEGSGGPGGRPPKRVSLSLQEYKRRRITVDDLQRSDSTSSESSQPTSDKELLHHRPAAHSERTAASDGQVLSLEKSTQKQEFAMSQAVSEALKEELESLKVIKRVDKPIAQPPSAGEKKTSVEDKASGVAKTSKASAALRRLSPVRAPSVTSLASKEPRSSSPFITSPSSSTQSKDSTSTVQSAESGPIKFLAQGPPSSISSRITPFTPYRFGGTPSSVPTHQPPYPHILPPQHTSLSASAASQAAWGYGQLFYPQANIPGLASADSWPYGHQFFPSGTAVQQSATQLDFPTLRNISGFDDIPPPPPSNAPDLHMIHSRSSSRTRSMSISRSPSRSRSHSRSQTRSVSRSRSRSLSRSRSRSPLIRSRARTSRSSSVIRNRSPRRIRSRLSQSPHRISRSPRRTSRSPRRTSRSPRRTSRSPRRTSRSPRRTNPSPSSDRLNHVLMQHLSEHVLQHLQSIHDDVHRRESAVQASPTVSSTGTQRGSGFKLRSVSSQTRRPPCRSQGSQVSARMRHIGLQAVTCRQRNASSQTPLKRRGVSTQTDHAISMGAVSTLFQPLLQNQDFSDFTNILEQAKLNFAKSIGLNIDEYSDDESVYDESSSSQSSSMNIAEEEEGSTQPNFPSPVISGASNISDGEWSDLEGSNSNSRKEEESELCTPTDHMNADILPVRMVADALLGSELQESIAMRIQQQYLEPISSSPSVTDLEVNSEPPDTLSPIAASIEYPSTVNAESSTTKEFVVDEQKNGACPVSLSSGKQESSLSIPSTAVASNENIRNTVYRTISKSKFALEETAKDASSMSKCVQPSCTTLTDKLSAPLSRPCTKLASSCRPYLSSNSSALVTSTPIQDCSLSLSRVSHIIQPAPAYGPVLPPSMCASEGIPCYGDSVIVAEEESCLESVQDGEKRVAPERKKEGVPEAESWRIRSLSLPPFKTSGGSNSNSGHSTPLVSNKSTPPSSPDIDCSKIDQSAQNVLKTTSPSFKQISSSPEKLLSKSNSSSITNSSSSDHKSLKLFTKESWHQVFKSPPETKRKRSHDSQEDSHQGRESLSEETSNNSLAMKRLKSNSLESSEAVESSPAVGPVRKAASSSPPTARKFGVEATLLPVKKKPALTAQELLEKVRAKRLKSPNHSGMRQWGAQTGSESLPESPNYASKSSSPSSIAQSCASSPTSPLNMIQVMMNFQQHLAAKKIQEGSWMHCQPPMDGRFVWLPPLPCGKPPPPPPVPPPPPPPPDVPPVNSATVSIPSSQSPVSHDHFLVPKLVQQTSSKSGNIGPADISNTASESHFPSCSEQQQSMLEPENHSLHKDNIEKKSNDPTLACEQSPVKCVFSFSGAVGCKLEDAVPKSEAPSQLNKLISLNVAGGSLVSKDTTSILYQLDPVSPADLSSESSLDSNNSHTSSVKRDQVDKLSPVIPASDSLSAALALIKPSDNAHSKALHSISTRVEHSGVAIADGMHDLSCKDIGIKDDKNPGQAEILGGQTLSKCLTCSTRDVHDISLIQESLKTRKGSSLSGSPKTTPTRGLSEGNFQSHTDETTSVTPCSSSLAQSTALITRIDTLLSPSSEHECSKEAYLKAAGTELQGTTKERVLIVNEQPEQSSTARNKPEGRGNDQVSSTLLEEQNQNVANKDLTNPEPPRTSQVETDVSQSELVKDLSAAVKDNSGVKAIRDPSLLIDQESRDPSPEMLRGRICDEAPELTDVSGEDFIVSRSPSSSPIKLPSKLPSLSVGFSRTTRDDLTSFLSSEKQDVCRLESSSSSSDSMEVGGIKPVDNQGNDSSSLLPELPLNQSFTADQEHRQSSGLVADSAHSSFPQDTVSSALSSESQTQKSPTPTEPAPLLSDCDMQEIGVPFQNTDNINEGIVSTVMNEGPSTITTSLGKVSIGSEEKTEVSRLKGEINQGVVSCHDRDHAPPLADKAAVILTATSENESNKVTSVVPSQMQAPPTEVSKPSSIVTQVSTRRYRTRYSTRSTVKASTPTTKVSSSVAQTKSTTMSSKVTTPTYNIKVSPGSSSPQLVTSTKPSTGQNSAAVPIPIIVPLLPSSQTVPFQPNSPGPAITLEGLINLLRDLCNRDPQHQVCLSIPQSSVATIAAASAQQSSSITAKGERSTTSDKKSNSAVQSSAILRATSSSPVASSASQMSFPNTVKHSKPIAKSDNTVRKGISSGEDDKDCKKEELASIDKKARSAAESCITREFSKQALLCIDTNNSESTCSQDASLTAKPNGAIDAKSELCVQECQLDPSSSKIGSTHSEEICSSNDESGLKENLEQFSSSSLTEIANSLNVSAQSHSDDSGSQWTTNEAELSLSTATSTQEVYSNRCSPKSSAKSYVDAQSSSTCNVEDPPAVTSSVQPNQILASEVKEEESSETQPVVSRDALSGDGVTGYQSSQLPRNAKPTSESHVDMEKVSQKSRKSSLFISLPAFYSSEYQKRTIRGPSERYRTSPKTQQMSQERLVVSLPLTLYWRSIEEIERVEKPTTHTKKESLTVDTAGPNCHTKCSEETENEKSLMVSYPLSSLPLPPNLPTVKEPNVRLEGADELRPSTEANRPGPVVVIDVCCDEGESEGATTESAPKWSRLLPYGSLERSQLQTDHLYSSPKSSLSLVRRSQPLFSPMCSITRRIMIGGHFKTKSRAVRKKKTLGCVVDRLLHQKTSTNATEVKEILTTPETYVDFLSPKDDNSTQVQDVVIKPHTVVITPQQFNRDHQNTVRMKHTRCSYVPVSNRVPGQPLVSIGSVQQPRLMKTTHLLKERSVSNEDRCTSKGGVCTNEQAAPSKSTSTSGTENPRDPNISESEKKRKVLSLTSTSASRQRFRTLPAMEQREVLVSPTSELLSARKNNTSALSPCYGNLDTKKVLSPIIVSESPTASSDDLERVDRLPALEAFLKRSEHSGLPYILSETPSPVEESPADNSSPSPLSSLPLLLNTKFRSLSLMKSKAKGGVGKSSVRSRLSKHRVSTEICKPIPMTPPLKRMDLDKIESEMAFIATQLKRKALLHSESCFSSMFKQVDGNYSKCSPSIRRTKSEEHLCAKVSHPRLAKPTSLRAYSEPLLHKESLKTSSSAVSVTKSTPFVTNPSPESKEIVLQTAVCESETMKKSKSAFSFVPQRQTAKGKSASPTKSPLEKVGPVTKSKSASASPVVQKKPRLNELKQPCVSSASSKSADPTQKQIARKSRLPSLIRPPQVVENKIIYLKKKDVPTVAAPLQSKANSVPSKCTGRCSASPSRSTSSGPNSPVKRNEKRPYHRVSESPASKRIKLDGSKRFEHTQLSPTVDVARSHRTEEKRSVEHFRSPVDDREEVPLLSSRSRASSTSSLCSERGRDRLSYTMERDREWGSHATRKEGEKWSHSSGQARERISHTGYNEGGIAVEWERERLSHSKMEMDRLILRQSIYSRELSPCGGYRGSSPLRTEAEHYRLSPRSSPDNWHHSSSLASELPMHHTSLSPTYPLPPLSNRYMCFSPPPPPLPLPPPPPPPPPPSLAYHHPPPLYWAPHSALLSRYGPPSTFYHGSHPYDQRNQINNYAMRYYRHYTSPPRDRW